MRFIYIPCMAMAITLLSSASFAEDGQECQLRCASENDTRNMACPTPRSSSKSIQAHVKCMQSSKAAYSECIDSCPPISPSSSDEGPVASSSERAKHRDAMAG